MKINQVEIKFQIQWKPTENHAWHCQPNSFETDFSEAVRLAVEYRPNNYAVRIVETVVNEILVP